MNNFLQGMARGAQGMQPGLQNPERPFWVTMIAGVIGFIGGIYFIVMLLCLGFINLLASLFPTPTTSQFTPTPYSPVPTTTGIDTSGVILLIIYLTFLAVSYLTLARGLYLLQQWAYWCLIGLEAFNFLVALIILIGNHNGTVFFTNIWLPLLIVAYMLTLGSVRRAFNVPF